MKIRLAGQQICLVTAKFFLLALLFCSYKSMASPQFSKWECSAVNEATSTKTCWTNATSDSLGGQTIPIKAFVPANVDPSTPVVFFLHGMGNGKPREDGHRTMFDVLGGDDFYKKLKQQNKPLPIIVAPQDTTIYEETVEVFDKTQNKMVKNTSRTEGADYWLGTGNRNWHKFLGEELKSEVESHFGQSFQNYSTAGVSMGAHGAWSLAEAYPETFAAFTAISPIFRTTPAKIDEFPALKSHPDQNIGKQIVDSRFKCPKQNVERSFVRIHATDGGYRDPEFSPNPTIFNTLINCSKDTVKSDVQVDEYRYARPDKPPRTGHSFDYFRLALPREMSKMLDYLNSRTPPRSAAPASSGATQVAPPPTGAN